MQGVQPRFGEVYGIYTKEGDNEGPLKTIGEGIQQKAQSQGIACVALDYFPFSAPNSRADTPATYIVTGQDAEALGGHQDQFKADVRQLHTTLVDHHAAIGLLLDVTDRKEFYQKQMRGVVGFLGRVFSTQEYTDCKKFHANWERKEQELKATVKQTYQSGVEQLKAFKEQYGGWLTRVRQSLRGVLKADVAADRLRMNTFEVKTGGILDPVDIAGIWPGPYPHLERIWFTKLSKVSWRYEGQDDPE